jgi:hypothetical protein
MADQPYHGTAAPAPVKRPKTGGRKAGTPNRWTVLVWLVAIGVPLGGYRIPPPGLPEAEPPKRKPEWAPAKRAAPPPGYKRCPACGETKLIYSAFTRHRGPPSGYSVWCRQCVSAKGKSRYQSDPQAQRMSAARVRRRKYGLSAEEFKAMLFEQAGLCKACDVQLGPSPQQLHVDHCHMTARVRGLLCAGCNCAIGHANESPARLRLLAVYLETSSTSDMS